MKAARARRTPRRTRHETSFDPDAAAQPGAGIFGLSHPQEHALVVLLPVPWEATTSYGGGASRAPAAIVRASRQVDLLDREFGTPWEHGIAMLPIPRAIAQLSTKSRRDAGVVIEAGGVRPGVARLERAAARVNDASLRVNAWVLREAERLLDAGKLVGVLGGDHSAPFGLIEALSQRHGALGVLHLDAHADLREAYEGFTWSHASIFHQVITRLKGVRRLVQVGVRDYGAGELELIGREKGRIRTHFDADLRRELFAGATWTSLCHRIVEELPEHVHISFDIDALSPDLCPHTGTPVPGGLSWAESCQILRVLSESGRQVVGFDLCEVVPGPAGDDWDANVGARLLYKLIGCAVQSRSRRGQKHERPPRRGGR